MSKIKKSSKKPFVMQNDLLDEGTVAFSFKYLTVKKEYNFESLNKDKKREWHSALVERMMEISKESWLTWLRRPKETGIETIFANQLRFSPKDHIFSSDEKVVIFRFKSQKGRIIGFKEEQVPIYYVIGFDLNFTAYDHGK